jgi:hypothetical protein
VNKKCIGSGVEIAAHEPITKSFEKLGKAGQRSSEIVITFPTVLRVVGDLELHGRRELGVVLDGDELRLEAAGQDLLGKVDVVPVQIEGDRIDLGRGDLAQPLLHERHDVVQRDPVTQLGEPSVSRVDADAKRVTADPETSPVQRGKDERVVLGSIAHAELDIDAFVQVTHSFQDFNGDAVLVCLGEALLTVAGKEVGVVGLGRSCQVVDHQVVQAGDCCSDLAPLIRQFLYFRFQVLEWAHRSIPDVSSRNGSPMELRYGWSRP